MGVAAVVEPVASKTFGNVQGNKQSAGNFSEILGKTISAGNTNGVALKTGKDSSGNTGRKDKTESKQGNSQQTVSQQAGSQGIDNQTVQNVVCAAISTVFASAGTAASADTAAGQTGGAPVAAVNSAEQTVAGSQGTKQVVETILTELNQRSTEIQSALTSSAASPFTATPTTISPSTADPLAAAVLSDAGQASAVKTLETGDAASEAAAVLPESTGKPAALKSTISFSSGGTPSTGESTVSTAGTAVHAAAEQPDAAQNSGQDGDAGSKESNLAGGKKEELPSLSMDHQTVQTTFQAQISAQADPQAELQELSTAVDKALERFQTDFQGLKTENSTIRIALEPKELGSLTITLASGVSGVTAKIRTDNPEAANLISDQVSRMVQSMEAKGVRVENVNVAYGGTAFQDFSGGGSGTPQQYGGNSMATMIPIFSKTSSDTPDVLQSYESGTGYYAEEDGVGKSVEYRV